MVGIPTDNIALEKAADQHSTYGRGSPDNGVDGNSDGHYFRRSCTETHHQLTDPWWRVDLGSSEPVSEVFLVNRADCCKQRLTDVEVRVGELSQ